MITAADLDTAEGLAKWRDLCAAKAACLPAQRFFTEEIEKGTTLREAIRRMVFRNEEAPTWPRWAWDNMRFEMTAAMRRHLLGAAVNGDPATAALIWLYERNLLEAEAADLFAIWHSSARPDRKVVLPTMEQEWAKGLLPEAVR